MLPEASAIIATENHNPSSKPKIAPATIAPKDKKPPITRIFLRNEKSLLDTNATTVSPVNKAKVIILA